MKYDFDNTPDRRGTDSLKWDIGDGVLPMWVADMDFAAAPQITAALTKRIERNVFGYTVVPDKWYDSIIGWWKLRHNFIIDRSWLQFCTGVVPAISCLVGRFTNVGDNVVLMTPVYDIFFHSVENFGRHVAECPLIYSGGKYTIDFCRLKDLLSHPLTTMLILCNPHNPTGNVWSRGELEKIGKLCKENGVFVISDEIHCDLTLPGVTYTPFASVSDECAQNSITCVSASKAFNLAGLQSAAVIVPNRHIREVAVRGLNSAEVAEPNCFAAEATAAAFGESGDWLDELILYLAENRRTAVEFLGKNAHGLTVTDGKATYLLWLDCSAMTKNTDSLCEFLTKKFGLALSAGSQYRGNGDCFLRMNIACSRAALNYGLKRLSDGLKAYSKL